MTETLSKADRIVGSPRRRASTDRLSEVPRLLLTRGEAARTLGMSLRHFQRHVQPFLPCVYSGRSGSIDRAT